MNRYGMLAMDHWRVAFPERYSQIPDPGSYFSTLGQQAAAEIAELEASLSEQQPSTGAYLSNVSSLRNAHSRAEEIVLAQRVYLTEELDEQENQEPDPAGGQEWIPLIEDPSHPWWQEQSRHE